MKTCITDNCTNKHYAKWYCGKCYQKAKVMWIINNRKCSVLWCWKYSIVKSYCKSHYEKYRRWTDFNRTPKTRLDCYDAYTHSSFMSMMDRCCNKKSKIYSDYWWKWIIVCDERIGNYVQFVSDMWIRPKWTSIDRIDWLKWYSKDNCRRANHYEQNSNLSHNNNVVWVSWDKFKNKWKSYIRVNTILISLWYHNDFNNAVNARKEWELKYLWYNI